VVNYTANPVNQRQFSTGTSTLALGFIHVGGTVGAPTLTVTSTGQSATTGSATLGSFTSGLSGFSLGLTSGANTNVFSGTGATQVATYTLSGSAATAGAISGTFSSAVTGEFAGIPNVTVAVTGQVYSGQSTWATSASGTHFWGIVSGTGANAFGLNWGTNQGSPGLDAAFANTDTATFGPVLTGGTAAIVLDGVSPSLQGLTFNSGTGTGSYEIYPGSGGGPITLLNAGVSDATVTVLAGSHAIHADVTLGSSAIFDVAAGSTLSLHTAISGTTGKTLTKTGAGTLNLLGNNTYLGNTLITGGLVAISSAGALGSGTVTLSNGSTLDLNGQAVTNIIDSSGGTVLNPASAFATYNVSGSTTTFQDGPYSKGTYNISSGGLATFQNSPYQATINVNNGGGAVFNAAVSGTATVNVNAGGQATVAAAAAGNFFVSGSATFASALSGALSVLNGGVVAFNGSNAGGSTFDVAAGGLVNVGSAATIGGPLHVSGSAVIAGTVTSNANVIVQSGGVVQLADGASFAQSSLTNNGSLVIDRTSSLTLATAISGSGGLRKLGSAALTLTGTSTFTGQTQVDAGKLVVNGGLGTGGVSVAAGGALAGSGAVAGAIGGGGLIEPGNSPGVLTADSLAPTGTTSFAFEFTGTTPPVWSDATASGNDVLRLTDATAPFAGSLGPTNVVSVYFDVASIAGRAEFLGGFFTDRDASFAGLVAGASYVYYVLGDGNGTAITYNGQGYYLIDTWGPANIYDYRGVTRTTVQVASANFASGTVTDGWSTLFIVVPEPDTLLLGGCGIATACGCLFRRRRRPGHASASL